MVISIGTSGTGLIMSTIYIYFEAVLWWLWETRLRAVEIPIVVFCWVGERHSTLEAPHAAAADHVAVDGGRLPAMVAGGLNR